MDSQTNFKVIRPSRKKPQRGDVFAIQLLDDRYLFGRVIEAELPLDRAPMPDAYLIYIYRERASTVTPPMDTLTPDRLLLPPIFINRLPWTKGYFALVTHCAIGPGDLLPPALLPRPDRTVLRPGLESPPRPS